MDTEKKNPMGQELVSVIVPAYNAENYISESLESILAQTHQELEIIVVDDGSTDRTLEIAEKYRPQVRCYSQQPNAGPSAARNAGIEKCSGEFICFVDADDLMRKDRISLAIDFMRRNQKVGLVFCDYRNFDDKRKWDKTHFQTCNQLMGKLRDEKEIILKNGIIDLAQENFGIGGNFLFRRSLLSIEPGFDQRLWGGEDFHFYYRLARHTPVGIINEVGMNRRLHESNATKNREKMLSMAVLSFTLLKNEEKNMAARTVLGRRIASFWSGLARRDANERRYVQSIRHELNAISCDMCYDRLAKSLRSFARTTLMAVGVHRPRELS